MRDFQTAPAQCVQMQLGSAQTQLCEWIDSKRNLNAMLDGGMNAPARIEAGRSFENFLTVCNDNTGKENLREILAEIISNAMRRDLNSLQFPSETAVTKAHLEDQGQTSAVFITKNVFLTCILYAQHNYRKHISCFCCASSIAENKEFCNAQNRRQKRKIA